MPRTTAPVDAEHSPTASPRRPAPWAAFALRCVAIGWLAGSLVFALDGGAHVRPLTPGFEETCMWPLAARLTLLGLGADGAFLCARWSAVPSTGRRTLTVAALAALWVAGVLVVAPSLPSACDGGGF